MNTTRTRICITLILISLLSACKVIPDPAQDAILPVEEGHADVQVGPAEITADNPPTDSPDTLAAELAPDDGPQILVITETNQSRTYGPDQQVIVFVEGFQPGEALAVSAVHETEGTVKSGSTEANGRGEAVIYHYVQHRPDDEGAYPQGEITFQVRGSTGAVKSYTFKIDYTLIPQAAETGCGTYPPSPIHLGGAFVAWCSGFDKADYQNTNYQTEYSISQAGNLLLAAQADVMADGISFLILDTEPGDPPGIWDIALGGQSFQIEVTEQLSRREPQ